MIRRTLLAAAAALALGSAHAQVEVAGVKYPPTAQLGGSLLVLNGAGVRYKFVVKVYTAGLYLGRKAETTEAVLAQPGPKRMHVVMQRDIDANELGRLFTRGMEDNAPRDEWSKSIPGTIKLSEVFSARKKLFAGDAFFVDYVPGQGTTIVVNGKALNEPIKEPEFFAALLRIWLGGNPADRNLKAALLGQKVEAPAGSQQQ